MEKMNHKTRYWVPSVVVALVTLFLGTSCTQESATASMNVEQIEIVKTMPNFSSYTDVKKKKQKFFDFLRPIVENENLKVKAQREHMMAIRGKLDKGEIPNEDDSAWLNSLASEYNVEMPTLTNDESWKLLRRRVDTVPFRLALAQAANESSWGTSRFAREGLNLFGQWCFTPGCGIVPAKRSKGMTHEVASYTSVNESVAAYIRSINRVYMYTPLRKLRRSIRKTGEKPTAVELAQELSGYSERGEDYVKEIQSMIRINYDLMTEPVTAAEKKG